ncbi:MAG: hypothetical protein BGO26_10350 [Actinobacteria bacterium 69-20]|nr:class I SAM-dependent methyltransferase [Actinomycetota bacterium]OJV25415.1 MAG: hypothetical protein BGO26_10350 [Actinobacteria bacterium 69-20]
MTHEHGPGHAAAPTATAADWDARYAASELIWGAGPNRFVAQHTADLPPGRAVDIACGEGRNAVYLAERGWHVTGVDFSAKALEKARQLEAAMAQQHSVIPVTWICADALIFTPDPVDLAMIVYAHLPAAVRRTVLKRAAAALRPGGRILVIGHNTRNITDGTGGPQNPEILYTATDIIDDLGKVAPDMLVEVAAEPLREVPGAPRPAIDTVVLARRP